MPMDIARHDNQISALVEVVRRQNIPVELGELQAHRVLSDVANGHRPMYHQCWGRGGLIMPQRWARVAIFGPPRRDHSACGRYGGLVEEACPEGCDG